MKKFLSILLLLLIVTLISNFTTNLNIGKSYTYSTINGEFTFWLVPSKNRSIVYMEERFSKFKKDNPQYDNLILYRTFKMDVWKFWNWIQYSSPIWSYPYLEIQDESSNELDEL